MSGLISKRSVTADLDVRKLFGARFLTWHRHAHISCKRRSALVCLALVIQMTAITSVK